MRLPRLACGRCLLRCWIASPHPSVERSGSAGESGGRVRSDVVSAGVDLADRAELLPAILVRACMTVLPVAGATGFARSWRG